jgi:hypothetical protein
VTWDCLWRWKKGNALETWFWWVFWSN